MYITRPPERGYLSEIHFWAHLTAGEKTFHQHTVTLNEILSSSTLFKLQNGLNFVTKKVNPKILCFQIFVCFDLCFPRMFRLQKLNDKCRILNLHKMKVQTSWNIIGFLLSLLPFLRGTFRPFKKQY